MTIAYWCVLIAIILPYVCTSIAKAASGRFDRKANHDPRGFQDGLQGLPRRAHAAQLNSFEALPGFAAAVILASLAGGAQQGTVDSLAVAFIVSRVLYILCYLGDYARLRSLVWIIGLVLVISLFVVAA